MTRKRRHNSQNVSKPGGSAPRAKRSFGQNFLVHTPTVKTIAGFVRIPQNRTVVELGVGRGALTKAISERVGHGGRIIGFELDRELVEWLKEQDELLPNVEVRFKDMLDVSFSELASETGGPLVIAGNLPYNISTQVVIKLIDERKCIEQAVFMFQKEVAQRLAAGPGSKQYGVLSVLTGQCMKVKKLMDVPPGLFSPRPKVMSSVVEFIPLAHEIPVKDRELFRKLVKQAFSKRRKTIRNALSHIFPDGNSDLIENCLIKAGIDPGWRAEAVAIKNYALLSDIVGSIPVKHNEIS